MRSGKREVGGAVMCTVSRAGQFDIGHRDSLPACPDGACWPAVAAWGTRASTARATVSVEQHRCATVRFSGVAYAKLAR